MKIRAIRAHEVGRFRDPVAVEGLSGGLDVLAGPNELGKSTLLKALKAALLRRHTTTALQDLLPYAGGHPLVELDFDTGGTDDCRRWRIRKRFSASSRQRLAELIDLDSQDVLRGPAAEEQLATLIGAHDRAPGRLGLLLVGQRDSHAERVGPDPAAGASVRSVIEREIAEVANGSRLRVVRAIVQQRLDVLVTAGQGRPKAKSEYAEAVKRRDALKSALDAAVAARALHAERLAALADKRRRLAALTAAEAPSVADLVMDTARRLEAARRAEVAYGRAREAHAVAEARLRALADIDSALQEEADLAQALAESGDRHGAADLAWRQATADAEAATTRHEMLTTEERMLAAQARARADADAAALGHARLADMEADLARAQTLAAEQARLSAALSANVMTAALADAIATLSHDIAVLEARLDAGVTRVRIAYADGVADAIRHDGQPLADGATIAVDGNLVLDIPGIGRIHVDAGARDEASIAADRERLGAQRALLNSALLDAGVVHPAEARQQRSERAALEQEAAALGAQLAAAAPRGLDDFIARVAAARASLAALPQPAADLPSAEVLASRLAALAPLRRDAELAVTTAIQQVAAARSALDRLTGEIDMRRQRQMRLAERLPLPALRSDERNRVATAAETATADAARARREAEALSPLEPDATSIAGLVTTLAALETREARERAEAQVLTIDIARIEATLAEGFEGGDHPNADAIDGLLEDAERAVGAYVADIAGLRLLAEELDAAERRARERFIRPVTERLAPYLSRLFGSAQLHFDETLAVTALARDGISEDLMRLSDGTREQIAVLTRLGFGRLLADGGEPAPLVLDDPLVFTDDQRLDRMFEILEEAARNHQVIVLTCHARAFDGLAGRRLGLSAWDCRDDVDGSREARAAPLNAAE